MKKILLNSTILAGLVAGAVSLWIVANPVSVHAASSWAACKGGGRVDCNAENSTCIGEDSTGSANGYCQCTSNTPPYAVTAFSFCSQDEPPLGD
jgi:predicted lipoprotein with Yx(FWY)xxD motif